MYINTYLCDMYMYIYIYTHIMCTRFRSPVPYPAPVVWCTTVMASLHVELPCNLDFPDSRWRWHRPWVYVAMMLFAPMHLCCLACTILSLAFSNVGLGPEIPMLLGCGQLCYISGAWCENPPAAYKGQPEWISTTTPQQKTTHSKPSHNHSTRRRGGWWVMTMTHDRGGVREGPWTWNICCTHVIWSQITYKLHNIHIQYILH